MKQYGTKTMKRRYGFRMGGHPHVGSGRSRIGKECRRQQNRRVLAFNADCAIREEERAQEVRSAIAGGATPKYVHELIATLWPTLDSR